jgi:hypothetical protein
MYMTTGPSAVYLRGDPMAQISRRNFQHRLIVEVLIATTETVVLKNPKAYSKKKSRFYYHGFSAARRSNSQLRFKTCLTCFVHFKGTVQQNGPGMKLGSFDRSSFKSEARRFSEKSIRPQSCESPLKKFLIASGHQ